MKQAVRRNSRRSSAGAALGVLGLCLLVTLRGQAASWLSWSAPAECQNTSEVERRLESLLGRPVDFAALPPTLVRMGWSAERGWSVRVTVQLDSGARDRVLDTPSCADGFDVIALSLALILDPSFDPEAQAAAEASSAPAPEAANPDPVLVAELETDTPGAPSSSDASLGEDSARARLARDGKREPAGRLFVGLGPITDLEVFPVPQFGAGAQLGLALGRFRAEAEGDLLASESTRFEGARYPVRFHSLLGAFRGCYALPLSRRLEWAGCVGAELGTLGTRERGGASRATDGLWLAAEVSTGPEFKATDGLRAFARLRGVSPLQRHDLLLTGGSVVHTLPWFSPQLQLGVMLDVTDFGQAGH